MCKVYYHWKLNSSANSDKMFGKRNKTGNNTFRLHCIYLIWSEGSRHCSTLVGCFSSNMRQMSSRSVTVDFNTWLICFTILNMKWNKKFCQPIEWMFIKCDLMIPSSIRYTYTIVKSIFVHVASLTLHGNKHDEVNIFMGLISWTHSIIITK